MKRKILFGASALALSLGATFSPAAAARQQGLVNVYAEDTTVQIPVGVAANVCGVDIDVLTSLIFDDDVTCTSEGVSIAQDNDGPNNGPVNQEGLINVALVDTTVQVPVSVAANICGIDVRVLAQAVADGPVDCDALADSEANA